MPKKLIAMIMMLMLITSCSNSSEILTQIEENSVQEGIEFPFSEMPSDAYDFKMMLEPRSDAVTKRAFRLSIPTGFDCDWVGDSQFDSNYTIYDTDTHTVYATARVNTAPPDLEEFYGTDDQESIVNDMISQFFDAENMHVGLRNNIVNDFGYDLVVDWSGTAYGMDFFYMEFIDEGTENHALRFYMSNGTFDNTFYAVEVRADLPMDDSDLIDKFREMVFTLEEA